MDPPTAARPAITSPSNSYGPPSLDDEKTVQPELEYVLDSKHDNGLSDQTFYLPRRKVITVSLFITLIPQKLLIESTDISRLRVDGGRRPVR